MLVELPIDQLREHPKQREFFHPLSGKDWQEFFTDINTRGIQQPVIVSDRTGEFVIADGHQRVRAAKHLGWLDVPCLISSFADEREEVRCLVMNNARRRQLSREEIDAIVKYWLRNYTGLSNSRIASEIGTTDKTVESKRREMETTSEIPKLDKLEGKDGRVRPRTQPKREPVTKECDNSAPLPISSVSNRENDKPKVISSNDTPRDTPTQTENVSEPYEIEQRPPVVVDAPAQPPGWTATETRKQLERAFTILTRLDSDEGRGELEQDANLRAFAESARRQLEAMLTQEQPQNLITIQN